MHVSRLRHTDPRPGRRWKVVALEHRDALEVRRERPCCEHAREAAADHDRVIAAESCHWPRTEHGASCARTRQG
jgi:hypothetical protein